MKITVEINDLTTLENLICFLVNENIQYNFTDIRKNKASNTQQLQAPMFSQENAANVSAKYFKKSLGGKGLEILKLLASGYKYNEIAEKTGISIDGVRYYIKKIFKYFGVNNGRDAVRHYLTTFEGNEVLA